MTMSPTEINCQVFCMKSLLDTVNLKGGLLRPLQVSSKCRQEMPFQ